MEKKYNSVCFITLFDTSSSTHRLKSEKNMNNLLDLQEKSVFYGLSRRLNKLLSL